MGMLDGLKLSDFIQLLGFLGGGVVFIVMLKGEIKMLATQIKMQGQRIDAQAQEIKQLATILRDQAVMQERMNAFDRALEDIRHWRGFINPSGEYRQDAVIPFEQR